MVGLKRYWRVILFGIGIFALLLSFQNCSDVMFLEQPLLVAQVPLCRDLAAVEVKPKLKWDWKSQLVNSDGPSHESFDQVMAAPMVADLDGDKKPEVVFVAFSRVAADWFADTAGSLYVRNGALRIVDGATGITKKTVVAQDYAPFGVQSPLLMDIDGDGKVEIFYLHYSRRFVIALNYDGSPRWRHELDAVLGFVATGFTGSDVDGDGIGEILVGPVLLSENAGREPVVKMTLEGSHLSHSSTLALALDRTKPAQTYLVNRYGIYNHSGAKVAAVPAGSLYFAAADLDPTVPGLEIVATGSERFRIISGLTGQVLVDQDLNAFNDMVCAGGTVGGGPPSIGDFDGVPETLEIAVATGRHLTIFDSQGRPKYKTITQDCSSRATGLTSFDLNGDKKPEILYADEEYMRIFEVRGGQLEIVHSFPNPSGTLYEYPVVADLSGDGTANILIAANNYPVASFYRDPGEEADRAEAAAITGVRAFESTSERAWMPTRPIWNQHSFHPDLVSNGARLLLAPLLDAKIFRRNNQGQNLTLECASGS